MENRLISMVDFVLKYRSSFFTIKYANFLKQPLQKWMFVPCGEDEEVLDAFVHHVDGGFSREYQQAKERCLFEGFEVSENKDTKPTDVKSITNKLIHVFWYNNINLWCLSNGLKTIEDLIKYNLTLTATAQQQLK